MAGRNGRRPATALLAATALVFTAATAASASTLETIVEIGDATAPSVDSFFEQPTTSGDARDTDFVCNVPNDSPDWVGTIGHFVVGTTPTSLFPGVLRSTNATTPHKFVDWSCQAIDIEFVSDAYQDASITMWRRGGEETEVLLDGVSLGTQMPDPFYDPHPMVTFEIPVGELAAGAHTLTVRGTERPAGADGYLYFDGLHLTGVPVATNAPEVAVDDVATTSLSDHVSVTATVADIDGLAGATCAFDWGDGSESTTVDASGGVCSADHLYAATGDHLVTVTASDSAGLTSSDSTIATVFSTEASVAANGRLGGAVLNVSTRYDNRGSGIGRVSYRETPKGLSVESDSVDLILVTSSTARVEGTTTMDGVVHRYVVALDLDDATVELIVMDSTGAVVFSSGVQELDKGGIQTKGA